MLQSQVTQLAKLPKNAFFKNAFFQKWSKLTQI